MKKNAARTHVTDTRENSEPAQLRPAQLELDGFGTVHPLLASGHLDPRFILSDETCRIGRKYLAEMRRILTASVERPAA
jgi:hypothetical protein